MKIPSIPQIYRHVNRWREILAILSKYGLADWISRFDIGFAKGMLRNRDGEILARSSRETRIRLALEELGPTFIKLGQVLSTRPDLVGVDLADELRRLQADVPADSPEALRQTLQEELGCPAEEIFAQFSEQAVASASIGQVHRARLPDGTDVAVKVQHRGIADTIRVDLEMLAALAQLAEHIPELQRYRPVATVAEFRRTINRELDFDRELRNVQHFAHDFADDRTVKIPEVYPEFSTRRVLIMQWLDGIKLSNLKSSRFSRDDLQEIARRGAHLYLEMIFRRGFYHADPHPGNLVLLEGKVIGLLDFGMVGRLDDSLRDEIEELLMAILDRDAHYLTSIIVRIGAVPPELDDALLRIDVADFVDHYGSQPIESFDLSGALREMIEIMRRYEISLPAPIAMLLKVLIMLEGTGQLFSPRFALMEVIAPYRQSMVRRRLSPLRHWKRMRRMLHDFESLMEVLPRRSLELLQQIQTGQFHVHLDHRGLEPSVNRLVLGMLASALFLGSSIMVSRQIGPTAFGMPIVGTSGCLLSIALGVRLLRAINKSGHLDRRK